MNSRQAHRKAYYERQYAKTTANKKHNIEAQKAFIERKQREKASA